MYISRLKDLLDVLQLLYEKPCVLNCQHTINAVILIKSVERKCSYAGYHFQKVIPFLTLFQLRQNYASLQTTHCSTHRKMACTKTRNNETKPPKRNDRNDRNDRNETTETTETSETSETKRPKPPKPPKRAKRND